MTNDDIARGNGTNNFLGMPPNLTEEPNNVYAIVVHLDIPHKKGIWKFASYIDNKELWTNPPQYDDLTVQYKFTCVNGNPTIRARNFCENLCDTCEGCTGCTGDNFTACINRYVKIQPVPNQYEMYYLKEK